MFTNKNKNSFHASASQNQSNGQKKSTKKPYKAGGYFHVPGRGGISLFSLDLLIFKGLGQSATTELVNVAAVFLLKTKHTKLNIDVSCLYRVSVQRKAWSKTTTSQETSPLLTISLMSTRMVAQSNCSPGNTGTGRTKQCHSLRNTCQLRV